MGTTDAMSTRGTRNPWFGAGVAAAVVLCLFAIAYSQRQALVRVAIGTAVAAFAHVHLHFTSSTVTLSHAVFSGVTVTSSHGEPIARIARLDVTYSLPDLVHGKRRYGLKSVDVVAPQLTIVRHADGSYNIPIPKLPQGGQSNAPPLRVRATLHDGSIDIVDRGHVDPHQRHLYVRGVNGRAAVDTGSRSRYTIGMSYGEQPNHLYPIRGAGDVDVPAGYAMQRWTAPQLPIAGAVDFALNSPSLHLATGELRGLDARIFGIGTHGGKMQMRLAATAVLQGARVAIGGLSKPVRNVHGRIDVDEGGLLARLAATLAGVPVSVDGGVNGISHPQLRLAVRGSGNLSMLRSAFAQSARLPVSGPISFAVLVQGPISKPLEWIALRSPRIDYGTSRVSGTEGLVAFDGQEADVLGARARYRGIDVTARGRVALQSHRNAVEMLVGAHVPPDTLPYSSKIAPGMALEGLAAATADNPKAILVRGLLHGASRNAALDGIFDVAANGVGSIGPVFVRSGNGDLYARVALDRPHDAAAAILAAHRLPAGAMGSLDADGVLALSRNRLSGRVLGGVRKSGGSGTFEAAVAGTPAAPRLAATVVADGLHYAHYAVDGNASLAFSRDTLAIHDAVAQLGPAFVAVDGTIAGLTSGRGAPRYDLQAQLHSSDAHALLALAQPQRAQTPLQGSVDANVHVGGTTAAPSLTGTIAVPEGAVNGLAFRDLHAAVSGDSGAISLSGGHVVVGSTAIAFSGSTGGGTTALALDAPHADLADFNDVFDTGDMFAGTGSLAMDAAIAGKTLRTSNGYARF
ncbi:MAG TPA: hypothetical protein VNG31_03120, partial [Candidatus Baltobacteraceae bacterium]|nr:hypothetical protein [Candidatus Baltobacteraceae bacterium]